MLYPHERDVCQALRGSGIERCSTVGYADVLGGLTHRDSYRVCACKLIPSLSLTLNERKGIATDMTELVPLLVKYIHSSYY